MRGDRGLRFETEDGSTDLTGLFPPVNPVKKEPDVRTVYVHSVAHAAVGVVVYAEDPLLIAQQDGRDIGLSVIELGDIGKDQRAGFELVRPPHVGAAEVQLTLSGFLET